MTVVTAASPAYALPKVDLLGYCHMDKKHTPPQPGKTIRALVRSRPSDAPVNVKEARARSDEGLLSPIRLRADEAEAIVAAFALSLEGELAKHAEAARTALAKIVAAAPRTIRARLATASAIWRPPRPVEDWEELMSVMKDAIRDEQELRIIYSDREGRGYGAYHPAAGLG